MDKMKKVYEYIEKDSAYNHAMTLLSWDLETEAPKKAVEGISRTMEKLSELQYLNFVNDEFKELLYSINEDELSEIDKKVVKKIKKDIFEKMSKIPVDEYSKYQALISEANSAWEEAKVTDNYELFKSYLKKLIETNKKFIKYRGVKNHPYDVLLDDFEDGLDVETCDKFFDMLREELVPFALEVLNTRNEKIEKLRHKLERKFDVEAQRNLTMEIAGILGFDFSKGVIKESEHPFTTNFNNKDVRLTTHYYEEDILSSIYSTVHETGHAIYEFQIDDKYDKTGILRGGSTMGIHEAQSRFEENVIGKHMAFMPIVTELLKKHFDLELTDEEMYLLVNEVKNQYIRTEADELTYPIHVMIRYEIEKEMFSDLDKEVNIDDLPKKWNDLYEKYLGIRPRNNKEGLLQDSHWAGGAFGYFPAYAIGSAYASQMYNAMMKEFNVPNAIKAREFDKINDFLRRGIHQYGCSLTPKELIKNCCGEDFDPKYYVEYLKEKFNDIYMK